MTNIQWADKTLNPIVAVTPTGEVGWHCERISAGCQNCYAETKNILQRFGVQGDRPTGTTLKYNRGSRDRVSIELREDQLLKPLRWRKGKRIFWCSMTDLFGEWVPDEMIDRMFAVMAVTPRHTHMVLTKRPERMREYMTDPATPTRIGEATRALCKNGRAPESSFAVTIWDDRHIDEQRARGIWWSSPSFTWRVAWPPPNVQLGVSVENQEQAEARIPELLATPAAVRFLSCEPLLGPVDIGHWCDFGEPLGPRAAGDGQSALDGVIIGGESGPGARPCNIDWIRDLLEQCQAAGIAPFVKQLGSKPYNPSWGGIFEGQRMKLRSRHGTDMAEWPEWARVREFPEVRR